MKKRFLIIILVILVILMLFYLISNISNLNNMFTSSTSNNKSTNTVLKATIRTSNSFKQHFTIATLTESETKLLESILSQADFRDSNNTSLGKFIINTSDNKEYGMSIIGLSEINLFSTQYGNRKESKLTGKKAEEIIAILQNYPINAFI